MVLPIYSRLEKLFGRYEPSIFPCEKVHRLREMEDWIDILLGYKREDFCECFGFFSRIEHEEIFCIFEIFGKQKSSGKRFSRGSVRTFIGEFEEH